MAKNRKKSPPTPVLRTAPTQMNSPRKPRHFSKSDSAQAAVSDPSPLRKLEKKFEMALSRPKVSVVIANHNSVDSLWHCLFALKTQTYVPHEIILVDNASEDASVSFVRSNYPQVKILECQENFGPAMACNLGATTATGDLVAIVSHETVVTPDWLTRMVRDFQECWPRFGVLAAPARNRAAGRKEREEHETLNIVGKPVAGFFGDSREVFYPQRGAVLYPRFLAPEGPFDSDYFLCQEDVYFGWKFRLLNHPAGKSTKAKVFQKPADPPSDFPEWKTVFYQNRNRWLNLFLFYETDNLIKVLPFALGEAFVSLARSLGTGFDAFWGTLSAVVWVFLHPLLIFKKRRMVQEKRKVRDRDILRYLSGRVAGDRGVFSRFLNLFSLAYCRWVGLEILESQAE